MSPEYVPVLNEYGEPSWQDPETGELYEMSAEDYNQIRLANLEQAAQQLAQQDQPDQGGEMTQEEWNDAVGDALWAEHQRLGRQLSRSEIERFVGHVGETGEVPDAKDWELNLDNENDRGRWMTERAIENAPTEPYSSKDNEQPTANEEAE